VALTAQCAAVELAWARGMTGRSMPSHEMAMLARPLDRASFARSEITEKDRSVRCAGDPGGEQFLFRSVQVGDMLVGARAGGSGPDASPIAMSQERRWRAARNRGSDFATVLDPDPLPSPASRGTGVGAIPHSLAAWRTRLGEPPGCVAARCNGSGGITPNPQTRRRSI